MCGEYKSNPSGSECSWAVADDIMRCAKYILLCTCINAGCIWLIHSKGFNKTFPMTDQQPFWQSQKTWVSDNYLEMVCLWLVGHTWHFCLYTVRNNCSKRVLPEGLRFYPEAFFEDRVFFVRIRVPFPWNLFIQRILDKKSSLKENFGWFNHTASLLKLPLACQYRRRKHIWSNHYRALWMES